MKKGLISTPFIIIGIIILTIVISFSFQKINSIVAYGISLESSIERINFNAMKEEMSNRSYFLEIYNISSHSSSYSELESSIEALFGSVNITHEMQYFTVRGPEIDIEIKYPFKTFIEVISGINFEEIQNCLRPCECSSALGKLSSCLKQNSPEPLLLSFRNQSFLCFGNEINVVLIAFHKEMNITKAYPYEIGTYSFECS